MLDKLDIEESHVAKCRNCSRLMHNACGLQSLMGRESVSPKRQYTVMTTEFLLRPLLSFLLYVYPIIVTDFFGSYYLKIYLKISRKVSICTSAKVSTVVWQNLVFQLRETQAQNTSYTPIHVYIMEPVMEEMREMSIRRVIRWVSATIMIFGGVIPYIPQYREIHLKQDAEGFSLYVCLALLIANTLRILFWFGKRYELPLLLQSIVMNVMMLAMIQLCVKVKNKNQETRGPDRVFTDFDWRYFWQWTDFQSYIDFLLAMSIILSFVTFLFLHSPIYVESIGFLALFTEAMLGVPQLLRNLRHKSTEGMSMLMVLMWTGGDAFKTVYFVVRQAPLQFWVCGSLQVLIDIVILGQVYWFRDSTFRASRPD